MSGQHGTSLKDYTQALTVQLRLRDVPGRAIGQIVAEVESHVRETGEDPVEAFGQPGSYSAQFAGRRRPVGRGGWLSLADVQTDVTFTMAMVGALRAAERRAQPRGDRECHGERRLLGRPVCHICPGRGPDRYRGSGP